MPNGRIVHVWVVVGDPDFTAQAECPSCGRDSLLTVPVYFLTIGGVGPAGTARVCPPCGGMEVERP